jgi:hypothetical protein
VFCFDRVGETSEIEEERVDKTKLDHYFQYVCNNVANFHRYALSIVKEFDCTK